MEIASTQAANAAPLATTGKQSSGLSSDFETFLRMLTAQLENQDPLNPLASTDFAVQLATFSNVEQSVRTNDLLAGLSAQMSLMGMGQLAGWVGMDARAEMPAYFSGAPIEVIPDPLAIADKAVFVVRNALGAEVQRSEIAVSTDKVIWDGRDSAGFALPEGLYTFDVESYSNDEIVDTSRAEVYARITEARNDNGQTKLVFPGGVTYAAQDVVSIRQPGG